MTKSRPGLYTFLLCSIWLTMPITGQPKPPALEQAARENGLGVKATRAGSFQSGMRHFAKAMALAPGQEVLKRNFENAAKAALGSALQGGRPGAGVAVCQAAEKVLGHHPHFGTMRGSLLAGQGQLAKATKVLARTGCLPGGSNALFVLARLRRNQGKLNLACQDLRKAMPGLTGNWKRQASAWQRQWGLDLALRKKKRCWQSNPLRLYISQSARADSMISVCRKSLRMAEKSTGLRNRVTVEVVFASKAELRALGCPTWASGLYHDGVVRIINDPGKPGQLTCVLAHEFTHAILARLGSDIPGWLHEGLAQLAEGRKPERAITYLRRCGGNIISASQLQGSFITVTSPDQAAQLYAWSLALTWFITRSGRGGHQSLLLSLRGDGGGNASRRIARWAGASVDSLIGRLARKHRIQPAGGLARPGR